MIADHWWLRMRGLLGKSSLDPGEGILLRPAGSVHMMFMRFRMDAVFLSKASTDGSRRVVALRRAMRPWTGVVWFARGADGVIELPAGVIDATGTTIGDEVRLEGGAQA